MLRFRRTFKSLPRLGLGLLLLTPAAGQTLDQEPPTRAELLRREREERRKNLVPYDTTKGEKRARYWERTRPKILTKGYRGFRALIGGIDDPVVFGKASSGSGLVGGIGYQYGLDRRDFRFRLDARYSTRGYEQIEGIAEFPTKRSDSPILGFVTAAYRDYKEVSFFGLGPHSRKADEANYRLEDRRFGAGVKILPNRVFFLDAGWSFLNTHVIAGEREPSDEPILPGSPDDPAQILLGVDPPEYFIYGGTAGVNLFDREVFPEVGVGFQVEVQRYHDRGEGTSDFTRLAAEFSAEIPLKYRSRRLAFRLRTAHHLPDAGDDVPFYLLETIGGGTTFRGFQDYRFRDRRLLLMSLEYRWEVWTYADFALFADGGKVFRKARDLDFTDLEGTFGFGLLIRTPFEDRLGRYGRLRFDIAKSREGFRFYIGTGPIFGRRHPPRVQ